MTESPYIQFAEAESAATLREVFGINFVSRRKFRLDGFALVFRYEPGILEMPRNTEFFGKLESVRALIAEFDYDEARRTLADLGIFMHLG